LDAEWHSEETPPECIDLPASGASAWEEGSMLHTQTASQLKNQEKVPHK
jgi:hypothetical protein